MAMLKAVFLEADASQRQQLSKILNADKNIEMIGMASNFMMAYMHIKLRKPDVFLFSESDSGAKIQAFIDDVRKVSDVPILMMSHKIIPSIRYGSKANQANIHLFRTSDKQILENQTAVCKKLCQTLLELGTAQTSKQTTAKKSPIKPSSKTPVATLPSTSASNGIPHDMRLNPLIALGASTGGTEALTRVLKTLSAPLSAVVIVQHIPAAFGGSFVSKLNKISAMTVVEAREGEVLLRGHVYVGVGLEQFSIDRQANHLVCRLSGQQRVSGHCPSVNVLFDSVAKHVGAKAVGALLTGMGEDGATGLKKMRDARARTLAQDEKTSVVWGMPGAAVKLGAAEEQAPLDSIARRLMQLSANGVR